MKPEELAQIRSESGLSQGELAILLNETLGRSYRSKTVSAWENGTQNIPKWVAEAVEIIGNAPREQEPREFEGSTVDSGQPEDTIPERDLQRIASGVPTTLESACIEMFQGIGMMIEVSGSVMGQPKVVTVPGPNGQPTKISLVEYDGRIVQEDAVLLGKAWAKLAEKNEWVARILNSLTGGGAWVEALVVTSGTLTKVYRNHIGYAEFLARQTDTNGNGTGEVPDESESNDGSVL